MSVLKSILLCRRSLSAVWVQNSNSKRNPKTCKSEEVSDAPTELCLHKASVHERKQRRQIRARFSGKYKYECAHSKFGRSDSFLTSSVCVNSSIISPSFRSKWHP